MNTTSDSKKVLAILTEISARLDRMESAMGRLVMEVMAQPAPPSASVSRISTPSHAPATAANIEVLLLTLEKLTFKRHAVLTATLGGMSYSQIAGLMGCDASTVKVHMRNTLNILGISSRSILLTSHLGMLDSIDDKTYRDKFGITKRWWLDNDPAVMAMLQACRASANQHARAKGEQPAP